MHRSGSKGVVICISGGPLLPDSVFIAGSDAPKSVEI